MRTLVGLVLGMWGSSCATVVAVLPTVTPIDTTRSYFVYSTPESGTGCGPDAFTTAFTDLQRFLEPDGYVSGVVVREGSCVVISALPFTYGCKPRDLKHVLRGAGPLQVVVPPPEQCTAAPVVPACQADCDRYAQLTGSLDSLSVVAMRDRCSMQCDNVPFMSCVRGAMTAAVANGCDQTINP